MLLPWTNSLVTSWAADPELSMLSDRHYSRQTPGAAQFCPSGRKLILRNTQGTVVFAWLYPEDHIKRADGQAGYNCTIFRNESERLSSDIILEAEQLAVKKWGPNRAYTYIDPAKVRSRNPGYCFKRAGWKKVGESKSGKVLLEKMLTQGTPSWL